MKNSKQIIILGLLTLASSASAAGLVGVYQQAVNSDPTFTQARGQWLQDKSNMTTAEAGILPSVDIASTATRTHTKPATGPAYSNSVGLSLSVSQPIFSVAAWESVASASYGVKAATATYTGAAQDLMVRTATAYFQILKDSATLHFDEAQRRSLLSQLVTAEQKYKVGLIAVTDVYQSKAQYDATIAQEIADRNTVQNDIESLSTITGKRYTEVQGLESRVPLIRPNPSNINDWVKVAVQQNYSLKAAINSMLAAKDNVDAAAAGRLPTLSATGTAGRTRSNATTGQYANVESASIGLSLNFPVYQGGSITGATEKAEGEYVSASGLMVQTHRQVINETRQAYLGIISGMSKIRADEQAVLSSKKALETTKAGYEVGTKTMSDVLEAVSNLYKAQKQYTSDQYDYILSMINLKEAAGTLSLKDFQQIDGWLKAPVYLTATHHQSAKKVKKPAPHHATASSHKPPKHHIVSKKPGDYAVQIFATPSKKDAEHFVSQHKNLSHIRIISGMVHGQEWYKVVVGNYETYATAQAQSPHFGIKGAWVVKA